MEIDYKIRFQRKRKGDTVFYCYKTNYPISFIVSHVLQVRNSGRAQLGSFYALCNVK